MTEPTPPTVEERVAALEERLTALEARVDTLENQAQLFRARVIEHLRDHIEAGYDFRQRSDNR